jgi:hypothetical protein
MKLKGCPMCHRKPKLTKVMDYNGSRLQKGKDPNVPYFFVGCSRGRHHWIQVGGKTEKIAFTRWNNRGA